jgi:hypothetical protein
MEKNRIFIICGIVILVLLVILVMLPFIHRAPIAEQTNYPAGNRSPGELTPLSSISGIMLTDVKTGEHYRIGDIRGKPVLLFAFTTWCSICTAQQTEIASLYHRAPGLFVPVGIDIDPFENDAVLGEHLVKYNFPGRYSIAPEEMTASLVSEFGPDIIVPSLAPAVVICENGSATRLPRGIKSADVLEEAVRTRC